MSSSSDRKLLSCTSCDQTHSGPKNFLLTCNRCERAWHHRCHRPVVPDKAIIQMVKAFNIKKHNADKKPGLGPDRLEWTCAACGKGKIKADTDSKPIPQDAATARSQASTSRANESSKSGASKGASLAHNPPPIIVIDSDDEDDEIMIVGPQPTPALNMHDSKPPQLGNLQPRTQPAKKMTGSRPPLHTSASESSIAPTGLISGLIDLSVTDKDQQMAFVSVKDDQSHSSPLPFPAALDVPQPSVLMGAGSDPLETTTTLQSSSAQTSFKLIPAWINARHSAAGADIWERAARRQQQTTNTKSDRRRKSMKSQKLNLPPRDASNSIPETKVPFFFSADIWMQEKMEAGLEY